MKLTNEARALYRKLNERRRMIATWHLSARSLNDTRAVEILQRRLIRLDRICDKALTREFRREDKGI